MPTVDAARTDSGRERNPQGTPRFPGVAVPPARGRGPPYRAIHGLSIPAGRAGDPRSGTAHRGAGTRGRSERAGGAGAPSGPRSTDPQPAARGPRRGALAARLPVRRAQHRRRTAADRRPPARPQDAVHGGGPGDRPAGSVADNGPGGWPAPLRALAGSPTLALPALRALRAAASGQRSRARARPQDGLLPRRPLQGARPPGAGGAGSAG